MRHSLLVGSLVMASLIGLDAAHAAVIFALTPNQLETFPGGSVEFTGTLTNTGPSRVYLKSAGHVLPGPFYFDDTPFVVYSPLSLAPGESYVGPFFDVWADTSAMAGAYRGFYILQGGPDYDAPGVLAIQVFQIVVTDVPEPNFRPLLALATVILITRVKGLSTRHGRQFGA